MSLSNSLCYFQNKLIPQEDFISQAFEKCLETIFDISFPFHPLLTADFYNVKNVTLSSLPESSATRNVVADIISKFYEGCKIFPHKSWDSFCQRSAICMTMANNCCDMQITGPDKNYAVIIAILLPCSNFWRRRERFLLLWSSEDYDFQYFQFYPRLDLYRKGYVPANLGRPLLLPGYTLLQLGIHGLSRELATPYDVRKYCNTSGFWNELTDYDRCHDPVIEHFSRLAIAGIVCKCVTIAAVIPACIIMLLFRTLRLQQRIRVHLCLLLASLLVATFTLASQVLIDFKAIQTLSESALKRNPMWCRALHLCKQYSFLALFMWMFIEFFHLHRLLMHAFTVPKTLRYYYIFGFGFPLVLTMIYGFVKDPSMCYTTYSHYDFICFGPSAAVLLVNLVLLVKIVHVLVRQLAPHPNEPSCFRRAVKAVVIMMPSLGIQYALFLVHKPTEYNIWRTIYDLLEEILCSLHGALIALVFCYLNKEIQTHLTVPCHRILRRNNWYNEANSQRTNTTTTQFLPDYGRSYGDGLENSERRPSENGTPTNGHVDESFIPLQALSFSKDRSGQAGNN